MDPEEESDEIRREKAAILLERAQKHQARGELADAIHLFKRSLETFPTAEAYTFLGWTYGMMRRYDEAIEACEAAIEVDPTLGNPYNDIGAYLIEQGRWEEGIPWFQKALAAPRYEAPQFPRFNLGRVYERQGDHRHALDYYSQALAIDPFFREAHAAKYALLGRLN